MKCSAPTVRPARLGPGGYGQDPGNKFSWTPDSGIFRARAPQCNHKVVPVQLTVRVPVTAVTAGKAGHMTEAPVTLELCVQSLT